MKNKHTLHKSKLIFDLDGTLYPMTPGFHERRLDAAAEAAVALGFEKDFETAKPVVTQSLNDTGYEMQVYVGRNKDISEEILEREYLKRVNLNCITKNEVLQEFLLAQGKENLAILTHSPHDEAMRTLRQIELQDAFNPNSVIGIDSYRELRKCHGDLAFDCAAKVMHATMHDCVFVEDSERNLPHAHDLGMTTVLITNHPYAEADKPKFVDYQCASIEEFMQKYQQEKEGGRQHTRFVKPRHPSDPVRRGSSMHFQSLAVASPFQRE